MKIIIHTRTMKTGKKCVRSPSLRATIRTEWLVRTAKSGSSQELSSMTRQGVFVRSLFVLILVLDPQRGLPAYDGGTIVHESRRRLAALTKSPHYK